MISVRSVLVLVAGIIRRDQRRDILTSGCGRSNSLRCISAPSGEITGFLICCLVLVGVEMRNEGATVLE